MSCYKFTCFRDDISPVLCGCFGGANENAKDRDGFIMREEFTSTIYEGDRGVISPGTKEVDNSFVKVSFRACDKIEGIKVGGESREVVWSAD